MTTLGRLEERVRDGVDEFYSGFDDDGYYQEIDDLIDYLTPVYTSDLLNLALNHLWLAEHESDSGARNAFNCIAEAVSGHLRTYAEWYIRELDAQAELTEEDEPV